MGNPVVDEILRQGRGRRRALVLAALATGRVEKNYSNTAGGDADSSNWRQERASGYGAAWQRSGGPLNLPASVHRFYQEARQLYHGQSPGELAADVQRPAAQYRGRYSQVLGEARRIYASGGADVPSSSSGIPGTPGVQVGQRQVVDQAGYVQAQRSQLVAQMLQRSGHGGSVLFKSGLLSTATPQLNDFTHSRTTSRLVDPSLMASAAAAPSSGAVADAIAGARQRLGITEVGSSNRGAKVDAMERRFGMVGQPWCGIFLGTVLQHAGVRGIDSRIASVAAIEQMARAGQGPFAGLVGGRQARAGDAVITARGQHVAFIESVDANGTLHVIGGNQSGGVTRGSYAPGSVYAVARVRYRH